VEKRKIKEMNQFRLPYIYTWKCHNETPCILNKQKYLLSKTENRKVKLSRGWYQWERKNIRKGHMRVNTVEILCTHV
jgi:hypothetical protein